METKPKTNGDRIRAMTDEELAEELADYLCNKIQDIGLCEKYEECDQGCLCGHCSNRNMELEG